MKELISILTAILLILLLLLGFTFIILNDINPLSFIKSDRTPSATVGTITPWFVIHKVQNIIDGLGYVDKVDTPCQHGNLSSFVLQKGANLQAYYNQLLILKAIPGLAIEHELTRKRLYNRLSLFLYLNNQLIYSLEFLSRNNFHEEENQLHPELQTVDSPFPNQVRGYFPAAIIIDDAGDSPYYGNWLTTSLDLTFAVIPDLQYSSAFCEAAHRADYEIIIHAPMKAQENRGSYNYILGPSNSEQEIRFILNHFIDQIPYAVGLNNHQGSIATQDREFLNRFFREYSNHPLFFVDSFTTQSSIAYEVATQFNIPAAKRDVFIDNRDDYAYIASQLQYFISIVKQQGFGIAIGHMTRDNTLNVLNDFGRVFLEEGITIVPLSNIIALYQQMEF